MEIAKHFWDRMKDKINVIAVSGRENIGWIGSSVLWAQDKLKKGWIQNPNHKAIDQVQNVEETTQNDN